jgi:hypothetical protein
LFGIAGEIWIVREEARKIFLENRGIVDVFRLGETACGFFAKQIYIARVLVDVSLEHVHVMRQLVFGSA